MYDTGEYANSRLAGTVVRHHNDLVYVEQVGKDLNCMLRVIGGEEERVAPLAELNLKPLPLGYCNTGSGAYYVQRIPKRNDWRQGLRSGNINCPRLALKHLVSVVRGIYPTFGESVAISYKQGISVAFSRHFCVSRDRIRYKGYGIVGKIVDNECVLLDRFKYLDIVLKEELNEN